MPYETDFDTAFTILLGKAQGTIAPTPTPIPTTTGGGGTTAVAVATSYIISFHFSGSASALPVLTEVPDAGEIVWSHVYAGGASAQPVAATTTIDLQRTSWATFGGSSPVYGSGSAPGLAADSVSNTSLSGWSTHLAAGDTLIGRITSFSGSATWVSLILRVRRDVTVQTQSALVSDTGDTVTDLSGNQIVFRN